MKKLFVLFLSAMMWLGNSSCQKAKDAINKLTEFDMSYTSDFNVPQTSIVVNTPVDLYTPDIQTNSATTFASQKTVADKVTDINLTRLNLTADVGNFNYLKSIYIYIQAPGMSEVLVASKTNVPDGITSLDMDVSGANVRNFVVSPTIKFRINVTADGPIAQDQKITLSETLHAKATLL